MRACIWLNTPALTAGPTTNPLRAAGAGRAAPHTARGHAQPLEVQTSTIGYHHISPFKFNVHAHTATRIYPNHISSISLRTGFRIRVERRGSAVPR